MSLSIDADPGFIVERFDADADPAKLHGVLFAEDFDFAEAPATAETPQTAAEPEPAAPTLADVEAAHAAGHRQGMQLAFDEIAGRVGLAQEASLMALTHALGDTQTQALAAARQGAEVLAGRILHALADLLPQLCADHGSAEAVALASALLPMLAHQPRLTVHANQVTLSALQRVLATQPGDPRIGSRAAEAFADGDVTIEWQDGSASRNTDALLQQIGCALSGIGISAAGTDESSTVPRPPHVTARAAEHSPRSKELIDAE